MFTGPADFIATRRDDEGWPHNNKQNGSGRKSSNEWKVVLLELDWIGVRLWKLLLECFSAILNSNWKRGNSFRRILFSSEKLICSKIKNGLVNLKFISRWITLAIRYYEMQAMNWTQFIFELQQWLLAKVISSLFLRSIDTEASHQRRNGAVLKQIVCLQFRCNSDRFLGGSLKYSKSIPNICD